MRRTRTEVFIETRERVSIKLPWLQSQLCPVCQDSTAMVVPDLAAISCNVSTRRIYDLVEKKRVHFREVDYGLVLVCLTSLFSAVQSVDEGSGVWG